MNYTIDKTLKEAIVKSDVKLLNFLPEIGLENAKDEILKGLLSPKKYLSPKFFYDDKGSHLFEQITQLKAYYPTRTEQSILSNITAQLDLEFRDLNIIELGSGDASKISLLLNQLPLEIQESLNYYPVDISESAIENSISALQDTFDLKSITGIVVDFIQQMHKVPKVGKGLFCFFGSTIGNLDATERQLFMENLGKVMQPGDSLLMGMDMVKDIKILENAYNDDKKITAAFNLNVLSVVNDIIGSDFNPIDFKHKAFYNPLQQRIEMHLEALNDLEISILNEDVKVRMYKGESIHTENSFKFKASDFVSLAEWAGLDVQQVFSDSKQYFSLVYFIKKQEKIKKL